MNENLSLKQLTNLKKLILENNPKIKKGFVEAKVMEGSTEVFITFVYEVHYGYDPEGYDNTYSYYVVIETENAQQVYDTTESVYDEVVKEVKVREKNMIQKKRVIEIKAIESVIASD